MIALHDTGLEEILLAYYILRSCRADRAGKVPPLRSNAPLTGLKD
jgi:hypothetical protein